MRRWLFVLPLLVGSQAFAQQSVPTINFESVPNPLKLPTNMYFGEVSGVAVNSKGHVFALSRGNTSGPAYAAAASSGKGRFQMRASTTGICLRHIFLQGA